MDTDFESGLIIPLWCTTAKEKHLLPWDVNVFQRMSVHPSVTCVHFTERSVGGTGLSPLAGSHFGWRLSGLSTRKMVQSMLPACLFLLPVKDNQPEFFHTKVPLFSLPGMNQAFPAAFPFPQAMSSSALHLDLQLLCFLFAGNGERRKWE